MRRRRLRIKEPSKFRVKINWESSIKCFFLPGGGKRGARAYKMMLYTEQQWLKNLIDVVVLATNSLSDQLVNQSINQSMN